MVAGVVRPDLDAQFSLDVTVLGDSGLSAVFGRRSLPVDLEGASQPYPP